MKNIILLIILAIFLAACASSTPASIRPTTQPPATSTDIPTDTPTKTPTDIPINTPTNTPTAKPTPAPVILDGCVSSSGLNVRSVPGTESKILGGLRRGACISIVGRNDDASWVFFSDPGGLSGWVFAQYLSIEGDINTLTVAFETKAVTVNAPAKSRATSQPEYILCNDTANKIGSKITCKIPTAYCSYQPGTSGSPTFCNDARYPNHNFTLLVWGSDWSNLDGDCLIVSGVVTRYAGKPQIEANSRSQVATCP